MNYLETKYRLYWPGSVYFTVPRMSETVSFAHVTDLHLPPFSQSDWPEKYRSAIEWWNVELRFPQKRLAKMLDEMKEKGVDFIFFGGDNLDYFHPKTADALAGMCRDRGLDARFQIGNHDWETEYIRFVTHEYDGEIRKERAGELCRIWNMPGIYYSFVRKGILFISLDTPYIRKGKGFTGFFDDRQADWFLNELKYDGPVIIFHHVPFSCPTVEYRLRAVWKGFLACIEEDRNGRTVRSGIEQAKNILGTFVGHSHIRSEDPIGNTCQFMTPGGSLGEYRYVKIDDRTPPKSMDIAGEPEVK